MKAPFPEGAEVVFMNPKENIPIKGKVLCCENDVSVILWEDDTHPTRERNDTIQYINLNQAYRNEQKLKKVLGLE